MSRLPKPGSDDGAWGDLLNDFLSVEHNADGSLKNAIPATQKGAASGVATLDGSSKLTAAQIPTTVELTTQLGTSGHAAAYDATTTALGAKVNQSDVGVFDGTSNIRAALVAAHAALPSTGGVINLPSGTGILDTAANGPVVFTKRVKLIGKGSRATIIQSNDDSGDMFRFDGGSDTSEVRGIYFRRSVAGVSGAAIRINDAQFINTDITVHFCRFYQHYDAIATESAAGCHFSQNYIVNFQRYGIYIRNFKSYDAGDNEISQNVFDGGAGTPAVACVRVGSGGGIRIENNKMQRAQWGVDLQIESTKTTLTAAAGIGDTSIQVADASGFDASTTTALVQVGKGTANLEANSVSGTVTGTTIPLATPLGQTHSIGDAIWLNITTTIFVVANNSIENQTAGNIRLGRDSGETAGSWQLGSIVANHLGGQSAPRNIKVTSYGPNEFTISGNVLKGAVSTIGMEIASAQGYNIEGNTLTSHGSGGIYTSGGAVRCNVGLNTFDGVSKPLIDDSSVTSNGPNMACCPIPRYAAPTSSSTYTNLFKLDLATYRSAHIAVTIDGNLSTSGTATGSIIRRIEKILNRDAAAVTVTAVTDVAAGAVIDVQFDTATTSGSCYIGVRRNSGGGGDTARVKVTLQYDGHIQTLNAL